MIVQNMASNLIPTPGAADQGITVSDSVEELTAFDGDTTHVKFTVDGADVRVTFDGSDPTGSDGHLIPANANGIWSKSEAAAMKAIRAAAVDAYLHATEYTLP